MTGLRTLAELCRGAARTALAGFLAAACAVSFVSAPALGQTTDVLTFHNDNSRTGQMLNEQVLTPANVNTNHFGLLWVLNADGKVDAQPLYAAGVAIPGVGLRNVLYVATENDSIYAFDADSTNVFWHTSLLRTNEHITAGPYTCEQVVPTFGVTATPVIDRQFGPNGTLFAVAMSQNASGSTFFQHLYALDLATGTNRLNPAAIVASYPGAGESSAGGTNIFIPGDYKERCALLLANGAIYTTWASHCDIVPYSGWIMSYDEYSLNQRNVLNVTPNGSQGAFWMSGDGPATDSEGNIYLLDANGTFDANMNAAGFPASNNFGNAFLKISTASNSLAVVDYFATFTNVIENENDWDLGSGGEMLLPDMTDTNGVTRQLAVGAGKDAKIYLVDRTNMGKFNPTNNSALYQEVDGAFADQVYSTPAYFNGTLYYAAINDRMKAFRFQNARLPTTSPAWSSQSPGAFKDWGATPSISANGTNNGIVWAVYSNATSYAALYAYAATNLATQLYFSNPVFASNQFGADNKFVVPTVASGRVYVGTTSGVGVFGIYDTNALTPLQVWRQAYFGNPSNAGAGANDACPAGDGVPNLVKYALGLNPTNAATAAQLPSGGIQQFDGQSYLALTVNRVADPPDVTCLVQVSSDLQNWNSGAGYTVTATNTPTQLLVHDATPVAASSGRFIRLIVTNP